MKFTTVAYKGSKRKQLVAIESLAKEIDAKTILDGFSGTGIVSAYFRNKGYLVTANDVSPSSTLFGSVFLRGYNQIKVTKVIEELNNLPPSEGWLTENYSGTKTRLIRGTGGKYEDRPLAFLKKNAQRLDAARDYINKIELSCDDKNAAIFSIILAANKVLNNSNDQKSSFKEWSAPAKKDIVFKPPTLITGPIGTQRLGDIGKIDMDPVDFVYLDPPYTHGVLYASCYHLNDSITMWTKPKLDYSYALPRPVEICFRKNGATAGGFYNKRTALESFYNLFNRIKSRRVVLSYSNAPRNILSIDEIKKICLNYGEVSVKEYSHKLCTQPKSLKKISTELKEYFLVIDKNN